MKPRAMRLGAILDDACAVPAGKSEDRVEIGRLPIKVHRDDGGDTPGRGCESARERGGIERHGAGLDIDKQRPRARKLDRRHRRHRRMRDGRDVIVSAEPERAERQHERVGAARDADRVRGAEICGEAPLERRDLGAEDVAAALEHAGDRRVDGRAMRQIIRARIGRLDGRRRHQR